MCFVCLSATKRAAHLPIFWMGTLKSIDSLAQGQRAPVLWFGWLVHLPNLQGSENHEL